MQFAQLLKLTCLSQQNLILIMRQLHLQRIFIIVVKGYLGINLRKEGHSMLEWFTNLWKNIILLLIGLDCPLQPLLCLTRMLLRSSLVIEGIYFSYLLISSDYKHHYKTTAGLNYSPPRKPVTSNPGIVAELTKQNKYYISK